VPELGTLGSVRGALSNERPYRDKVLILQRPRPLTQSKAKCAAPLLRGANALPWSKTPSRTKGTRRNLGGLMPDHRP